MNGATQTGLNGIDDLNGLLQSGASSNGTALSGLDVGSLLGNMSTTVILINIVAGLIGAGYFMFGKRTLNIPMTISGILLCVVPYFISSTPFLILACLIMVATPFLVERYF